jgi:CRP-like cAMP-binding protein
MPHYGNQLLAGLDPPSLERLRPHLRTVALSQGQVVADSYQRVQLVYFPHSGVLSAVVDLKDGQAIETGMIGCDGEFGAGPALDGKITVNRVVTQVAGAASVIDSDRLREAAEAIPALRRVLIDHEQYFLAQVQQTAACNASHDVEARMCKWFLRMHDLAGSELPLTQEFLSQMMGVRRTSVTGVATVMQRDGLISYSRGRVHLLDLAQLRQRCCECYATLQTHRAVLLGPRG